MAKEDVLPGHPARTGISPTRCPVFICHLAICHLALYAPAVCGIGGILRVHAPGGDVPSPEVSIPEAWLDILDQSVRHRGPDGQGRFRDRVVRPDGSVVDVALVHRRMAVIDLACGAQPMVSARESSLGESGLVAVVFNGCIYNHRELRAELESLGHVFETDHSDTEVLLHGWRAWGAGLFGRLEGMYAIGLWDRAYATLIVARDRFGEKPMYCVVPEQVPGASRQSPGLLTAFASVVSGPAAVLRNAGVRVMLSTRALNGWIALGGLDADTPLDEIHQIPPGGHHTFPIDLEHLKDQPLRPRVPATPPAAQAFRSADDVEAALSGAVAARLEADVPLGCFLSGGIDSSLVAWFARRQMGSLRTFTVRMDYARYDESVYAEAAARIIGSTHTTIPVEPSPAEDLVGLIEALGLPFGDSSLLPTYWVSRAARRHVSVCLSGDGGDELFMGYDRYQVDRQLDILTLLRPLLSLLPVSMLHRADPKSTGDRLARFIVAGGNRGYQDLLAIFQSPDLRALRGGRRAAAWYHGGMHECRAGGPAYDIRHHLPADILRKVDTASMAVALEVRAPFLDRALASAAMATPRRVLMPHGERKGLLKQVARKYLPRDIVDRPKMGFAIPIGEWFRSDYGGMRQLLLDHLTGPEPFGPDSLGLNAMINMDFVRRMLKEHDEAGRASLWPWRGRDHSQRLYMLLVLSIWAKWLGGLK